MKQERRTRGAEIKARVAREALEGSNPSHQIAAENEILPVQVSQWNSELAGRVGLPRIDTQGAVTPCGRRVLGTKFFLATDRWNPF
ncbi:hypothetical protein [Engelhardtia mirabilis]